MQVYNLVIEVTRKCNLQCAHCLRGPAQRMTMSREVLHKVLSNLSYISSVTFTGGEPSLAPEVIEDFLQDVRMRGIEVGYFYVVSNGQPHNRYKRFLRALSDLYEWCAEKDACCLEVSQDQFHPGLDWRSKRQFENEWGEYLPFFYPKHRTGFIPEPINEGNAVKTGVGRQAPDPQKPWTVREDSIEEETLYISANGNVTSCCDMAFKRIDTEHKGNILKTSLQEIIESFCLKDSTEEEAA